MGFIAPKERKHLSADTLFALIRSGFANIPDHRSDDAGIPLTDALMSAFAMFSLKSPSLLAFDKQRAEGNLSTIYGIERAPCDSYMRETLDPVSPESLRPSFKGVFRQLQRGKALEAMTFLEGHDWVALDGTGYFSSQAIRCCPSIACMKRLRSDVGNLLIESIAKVRRYSIAQQLLHGPHMIRQSCCHSRCDQLPLLR